MQKVKNIYTVEYGGKRSKIENTPSLENILVSKFKETLEWKNWNLSFEKGFQLLKIPFCWQAINDFLKDMDWETFTLIYESSESLILLQEVLKEKMGRSKYDRPAVVMKELPESDDEFKSVPVEDASGMHASQSTFELHWSYTFSDHF